MRTCWSLALIAGSLLLAHRALAQQEPGGAPAGELFAYTRVLADAAGVSHYADADMAMSSVQPGPGFPAVPATDLLPADGLRFFCFADGTTVDWHPAPRRQFYFVLSGRLELEVADGEVRRFGPGSVLLGESTEGKGVRAHWSAADQACVGIVPLADVGGGTGSTAGVRDVEEHNKELARGFYQDLWFSDHTDRWDRYVADEYVVHDIGDRKGITEPGIEQKRTADFFHSQGEMSGAIDFQIADGDLVATRWQWDFRPTSLLFKVLGGRTPLPIINVFRFRDGKIVEIWNHRHDIDFAWGRIRFFRGLGVGLLLALPGWVAAGVLWRRRRSRPRAA